MQIEVTDAVKNALNKGLADLQEKLTAAVKANNTAEVERLKAEITTTKNELKRYDSLTTAPPAGSIPDGQ